MMHTVAVLSALQKESLAFFELPGEKSLRHCGVEYAERDVSGVRVVAANGGMGTINSAASAQFLIDRFGPDALLFCGIAGSLNPRIGQGDVVVGARLECLDSDMQIIAVAMDLVLTDPQANMDAARALVKSLTDKYPLYE